MQGSWFDPGRNWEVDVKYFMVDPETREKITRVRNIVVALGNAFLEACASL